MNTSSLFVETKQHVEAYLDTLLKERSQQAAAVGERYALLWNAITNAASHGKRLRPYLVMAGYGSFHEAVVPIAAAQELVHTAMLIHDDIIDQDTIRHGEKNVSGSYVDAYSSWLPTSDIRHYADSAAILAGDALLSEAYHAVATSDFSADHIRALQQRLHQSVFEVIGGELLDVEAAFVQDTEFDPMAIYRYKTASYSFIGPLLSGAICADASSDVIDKLSTFGLNAGIAFQLQDDLLGLFGDESVTGKSTTSDLQEAKATYLITAHKARMDTAMSERFAAHFGAGTTATDYDYQMLKDDIEASGARAEAERLVEEYYTTANEALVGVPQAEELRAFINTILQRDV